MWRQVCEADGLQLNPEFLQKMIQLYETLKERHGVMVVGPPASAKTTTIKVSLVFLVLLHFESICLIFLLILPLSQPLCLMCFSTDAGQGP